MKESDFLIEKVAKDTVIGFCGKTADLDLSKWEHKTKDDWAGFYLAATKEHAKNYADIPGNALFQVSLRKELTLITCTSETMGDGTIAGDKKAAMIREALKGKYPTLLTGELMEGFGALGCIFKCFEHKDSYEIAIPDTKVNEWVLLTKIKK